MDDANNQNQNQTPVPGAGTNPTPTDMGQPQPAMGNDQSGVTQTPSAVPQTQNETPAAEPTPTESGQPAPVNQPTASTQQPASEGNLGESTPSTPAA